MSTHRDGIPSKADGVLTAAQSVKKAQFNWLKLAAYLAPCENVKGQYRAVARETGLSARRQKDIRAGTLNQIPAHQLIALEIARERARKKHMEIENAADEVAGFVLAARARFGAPTDGGRAAPGAVGGGPDVGAGPEHTTTSRCHADQAEALNGTRINRRRI